MNLLVIIFLFKNINHILTRTINNHLLFLMIFNSNFYLNHKTQISAATKKMWRFFLEIDNCAKMIVEIVPTTQKVNILKSGNVSYFS